MDVKVTLSTPTILTIPSNVVLVPGVNPVKIGFAPAPTAFWNVIP
jgi:hypothetical protein